jgi:hypothetical protein
MDAQTKAALIVGVVALVAGALVLVPRWLDRKRRRSADASMAGAAVRDAGAVAPRVFLREQTPQEVLSVLESALPLEREELKQRMFIGRWVRWRGELVGVERATQAASKGPRATEGNDGLRLTLEGANNGPLMFVRLPDSERPTVEALRKGDFVVFEGQLKEILSEMGLTFQGSRIVERGQKQDKPRE